MSTEGANLDEGLENELLAGGRMNPALSGPNPDEFTPPDVEEEDSMISMQKVDGKLKASSVKKVEDIVDQYPAETVSVIRSWMTQES